MAAFGKTTSTRQGNKTRPELVTGGRGEFPRGDYSSLNGKIPADVETFHKMRWENVDKQVTEIRKVWDGEEPMWAIISVETGAADEKKIGLEMRAQTLGGPYSMAFMKNQSAMRDLLRDKTHRSDGDMDEILEINGLEELTVEEVKKKSKILSQGVTLITVKIDGEKRQTVRKSVEGQLQIPGPDPAPPSPPSPRPPTDTSKEERELRTILRKLKNAGKTLPQVQVMVEKFWEELPAPEFQPEPRAPEGPEPEGEDPAGASSVPEAIRRARESDNLAYCCFHLAFTEG